VCDRFPIVYLLYWNFLPRLGKLLNTRWLLEMQRAPNDAPKVRRDVPSSFHG
jgi:hypothetical protein